MEDIIEDKEEMEISIDAKTNSEKPIKKNNEKQYQDPFTLEYCTKENNKCGNIVIKPSEFIITEKFEEIKEIEPTN